MSRGIFNIFQAEKCDRNRNSAITLCRTLLPFHEFEELIKLWKDNDAGSAVG